MAADFFPAAWSDLLTAVPDAVIERLGPDLGCLTSASCDVQTLARLCQSRPMVFIRHLMRDETRVPLAQFGRMSGRVVEEAIGLAVSRPERALALQLWASGNARFGLADLRSAVAAGLADHGFTITRGSQPEVMGICATSNGIILGLTPASASLADWPGGRVPLARSESTVSRAEFKLEELLKVSGLSLPWGGAALDLGAAPGGWTRILRGQGCAVWAIDPGELDPRVASDPGVHQVATTAGRFLAQNARMFDLVVNDMRMAPAASCQVMVDAADHLKPDGLAIMTLKITPIAADRTVRAALDLLAGAYDVVFARQLFHNRHEVTVVARRRGIPRRHMQPRGIHRTQPTAVLTRQYPGCAQQVPRDCEPSSGSPLFDRRS